MKSVTRFCGYCYPHKTVRAIGDVEGSPVCKNHWRKYAKGSSSFLYTRPRPKTPKS